MPTECERMIANTSQNVQQTQQQLQIEEQRQQQQQQYEQLQGDHLQAKAEEEAAAAQLEFYDDMEGKELKGGKMSTSQTSPTSAANGHSGSNQANGVGKKTSIISPDPTSYVTKARVTRPTPPPPSYNPMQFVQIKPCNLYQTAQEQLKKAEEVKKIKEIKKEEPEDWQNNLDNWKSSRRKRVEHIIDRVVEVKKLELEEHDRTRRKSKTFSEMIEERGERGGRGRAKLASLAVYNEDESNDLSDLGIGTSSASGKSSQSEDYDNNSVLSDNAELAKALFENNQKPSGIPAREYISSPGYDTSSSTAPGSSPDPCEYTYEGAIQDYKQRVSRASGGSVLANFKLNNVNTNAALISKTNSSKENTPDCSNALVNDTYPTRRGSKIEDRLIGFEVTSPSDSQDGLEKKVDVPKIDISKRKEIFENQNATSEPKSLVGNAGAGSVAVPRVTLRDHFKLDESVTNNGEVQDSTLKREVKRLSGDITSIRSRMQSLEQQQNLVNSTNGGSAGKAPSAKLVDIPVPPLKDRLSSLQNAVTKEEVKKAPIALVDARQLEIMKNEEEGQRMKLIENEKKTVQEVSNVEKVEISAPVAETKTLQEVVVKIEAPEEEVDRDDSGIHTTDGEVEAEATEISEQEEQLNAAIAALALEEQQLTEAANAVNQIEAEFAELSTNAVNTTANSLNRASTAKTTNEQPCEMEFSINEALELALEAIDKETEFTTNDAATIKETTKSSNTIASNHTSNTVTTTKLAKTITTATMSIMKTEIAINNNNNNNSNIDELLCASDTSNKTDEEKERKSKHQKLQHNANAHNMNTGNDDDNNDVDGKTEELRETLISQEPIYENISAASTRQVDTEAKRILPASILHDNNNKANNNIHKPINQININNKINNSSNNNDFENSFANNSLNNILTNNNNNNCNGSYSVSDNNNIRNVDNTLTELTNAYANNITITTAAGIIATTTTTTTTITSVIEAAPSDSSTSTSIQIAPAEEYKILTTTTASSQQTEINSPVPTFENLSKISKSVVVDAHTVTDNSATLAEHEPYYQVPKFSEPYYDAPKHLRPVPLYENIEVFYSGLENSTLATGTGATLNGDFKLEPPKEKPPPPPVDSPPPFDDVDSIDNTDTWSSDNTYETISSRLPHVNGLAADHPSPPIKRMNSTKRIKKELRNKRSSFLGIDTTNLDDEETYLELTVAPPPDMAQLLQEERRLEKQLYLKAGLCDSSDTGESRDSGVSENHSRQSSEHYTNSSEENDRQIDTPPHSLKSNELIYQNETLLNAAQTPLLQTVKGNSAESWTESATVAAAATKSLTEATATANAKMLSIEEKIREQEEVLRVERELLQLEQEELKRQRENLMLRENMARRELQHGAKMLMSANRRSLQDLNGLPIPNGSSTLAYQTVVPQYTIPAHNIQKPTQQQFGVSLLAAQPTQQIYANVPNLEQQYYQVDIDYRKSMSDLQEFSKRHMLPPMPPTKPMRAMQMVTSANALVVNSTEDFLASRHTLNAQGFGGSLVKIATPTAAPSGHSVYPNNHQYQHESTQNQNNSSGINNNISGVNMVTPSVPNGHTALPGNMSRNTLHALSATPKPKYTDGWVQVQQRKSYDTNFANDPAWLSAYQQKRKSMPEPYHAYNNHWLVQEAEQRRISEQQRRGGSTATTPVHKQNGSAVAIGGMKSTISSNSNGKPLPDSIIQTLTERVQSKGIGERKRFDNYSNQSAVLEKSQLHAASTYYQQQQMSQPLTPSHQRLLNGSTLTAMLPQANVNASPSHQQPQPQQLQQQDKVLSVSGKKKCSHCGDELGRGAAMIIESLLLFYHINCFKCCVCHVQLGDGLNGTDVRVRNHKLHCQNCYSSDDGIKFSCV